VELLRERSTTLIDMARRAHFLVSEEIAYEEKAARKFLRPESLHLLEDVHARLAELGDWTEPALESAFEAVRAGHGDLSMGKIAQPVRVAITGTSASPGIYETLVVLGKTRSVGRIAEAIHYVRHG
jgi:glutamyl-tRNA synthetase